MRSIVFCAALLCGGPALAGDSVHTFKPASIDGEQVPLSRYRGKVVLIVNTASRCGFTRQYAGLEQLHQRYKDRGLVVLGFPCNDFGGQEPGSEADIKAFCTDRFKVSFPMFSKVRVRGPNKTPLYRHLTQAAGEVRWNFAKFLVDHEGRVLRQFQSSSRPLGDELTQAVESALGQLPPAPTEPAAEPTQPTEPAQPAEPAPNVEQSEPAPNDEQSEPQPEHAAELP